MKPPTNNLPKSINFKCYFPVIPSSTHEKEKKKKKKEEESVTSDQAFFLYEKGGKWETNSDKREDDRRLNSCLPRGRGFAAEEVYIFSAIHWECLRFCGLCGNFSYGLFWKLLLLNCNITVSISLNTQDKIFLRFGRFSTCYCWICQLFFAVITVFGNPTYPLCVC